MRIALIPLVLAGMAGGAAPAAERDPLAGRVAGKPVDCIASNTIGGPDVIDNRTILYREARRIWRNDLPDACPGLRPDVTLIVDIYGSQLCRNDHFRTRDTNLTIPGPTCRLGSFTPYDLPK